MDLKLVKAPVISKKAAYLAKSFLSYYKIQCPGYAGTLYFNQLLLTNSFVFIERAYSIKAKLNMH